MRNKPTTKYLTVADKEFVGEIIKKKTGKEAARIAYNLTNEKYAEVKASVKLSNTKIQTEIAKQMDKVGLTTQFLDESTSKIIESGLNNARYTKPSVALHAIEMVNKLKDRFPATKTLNASLNLTKELEDKSIEELKGMLEDIQESTNRILAKSDT